MVGGIGRLLGGIFMRGNQSNFWRQGALYSLSHRFSMGFRSGEFAGQSSTVTPWSLNQLLVPLAAGPARGIGDIGSCLGRKMTGGAPHKFFFSRKKNYLVTIVRSCTHILSKMITDS